MTLFDVLPQQNNEYQTDNTMGGDWNGLQMCLTAFIQLLNSGKTMTFYSPHTINKDLGVE